MTIRRPTRVPATTAGARPVPTGIWLLASRITGRPVPVDGPYPHVDGYVLSSSTRQRVNRISRRDCAACHAEQTTPQEGPA